MKKKIEFIAAQDGRTKGYGISTMKIRFVLIGKLGAVQHVFSTGIYPKGIRPSEYMGYDLGYHSPKPLYEGQAICSDNCDLVNAPCYYDGSTLNAEPVADAFVTEGEDAVWKRLEEYYSETFGGAK